jgi:hypothetical protein
LAIGKFFKKDYASSSWSHAGRQADAGMMPKEGEAGYDPLLHSQYTMTGRQAITPFAHAGAGGAMGRNISVPQMKPGGNVVQGTVGSNQHQIKPKMGKIGFKGMAGGIASYMAGMEVDRFLSAQGSATDIGWKGLGGGLGTGMAAYGGTLGTGASLAPPVWAGGTAGVGTTVGFAEGIGAMQGARFWGPVGAILAGTMYSTLKGYEVTKHGEAFGYQQDAVAGGMGAVGDWEEGRFNTFSSKLLQMGPGFEDFAGPVQLMGISKKKDLEAQAAVQKNFASDDEFFPAMEATLREYANLDIPVPDWMLPKSLEGMRVGPAGIADANGQNPGGFMGGLFGRRIDDSAKEAYDESEEELKAAAEATRNLKDSIVVLAGKLGKYDTTIAGAAKGWEKANLTRSMANGDMAPMDSGRLWGKLQKLLEEKSGSRARFILKDDPIPSQIGRASCRERVFVHV